MPHSTDAPRSSVVSNGRPTPLDALLARAERDPGATALVADGRPWSCARLAAESARLAAAMRARGVRPGDRVALHMFNRAELVLAYLACWRVGAIAVPLNTRLKPPELAAMLARVRPALYLGQAGLSDGVRDVAADALAADARFVVGPDALEDGARGGARPWAALLADTAAAGADPGGRTTSAPADRDAPALLLTTSGTTGESKLVVWTQRMMTALTLTAEARGLGAGRTFLINVPMMHVGGVGLLSTCLLTGAVTVLLPQFEPDAVLDAVAEHRCTTFHGLPSMCAEVARAQRARSRDVSSLRVCFTAADTCPAETERAFADAMGCPLVSLWGATEDLSCTIPTLEPGPRVRLLPEVEARLVDEAGAEVAEGEAGELWVRSPGTTPGYWRGPDRIEPLPDGWFHTGDLMRREADGPLRYMGRTKDLIVRGGSNISPVEVEAVLRRQPGVADAAVAGLPAPELGERVGAVVTLADGTGEDAITRVLAGARRELADYKVPERVAVVEAIPRNALTKVDRRAIADRLGAEAGGR